MNSRKRIAKAERDLAHWSSRHNLDGQQSLEIKRAGDSLEQLVTELRDLKTGAEAEGDRRLALDCVRVLLSIDERRNASRTPRIDAEEGLCPVMDLGTQIRVAQTFLQRQSTYQGQIAPEARHTVNPLECNRERSEPKQTSSGAVDKISQENEAKPAPPLTRNQPQSAANQLPASWLNPKW